MEDSGALGADQSERRPGRTDVVLVVMPFADTDRPAIGVSLLKAAAASAGWTSAVEYLNLTFAERIGADLYAAISDGAAPDVLAGEWAFADDVFGERIPPAADYVSQVLVGNAPTIVVDQLEAVRHQCRSYLDECAARIRAHRPRVVGFTTTFHQTCASLAVARRLKAADDPPQIVFGGANCEGEMGEQMLASFPWIDHVASGEADHSFVRLLEVLLNGATGSVAGVTSRDRLGPEHADLLQVGGPIMDLDQLPIPDFDDYFDQLHHTSLPVEPAHLVIETSRGCWWGAKHHCTFCGLNGDSMTFRSKSPDRVVQELRYLCERHDTTRVGVVDNILDMRYIDTLFPRLKECDLDLSLFYEVKANLRYDQLVSLRAGGVRQIQPGIESLSDDVLKLMDKGVTALQNVSLLRWCSELDLQCSWNVLAGFPGEAPEEYRRMADLLPLLSHLQAPMSTAKLRLDRFSPFHRSSASYGFRRVRPSRAYFYVFPIGRQQMRRLAYYFDYDYADGRDPDSYLDPLVRQVQAWWDLWADGDPPRLDAEWLSPQIVTITDTRPVAVAATHTLTDLHAQIFLACDTPHRPETLARQLDIDPDEAGRVLSDLVDSRLTVQIGDRFASLAVFRRRPSEQKATRAVSAAA